MPLFFSLFFYCIGLGPFILSIVSDRYIILSVNEDGITVALELARILDKICSAHDWRPRRSLVFCVSLVSSDVCPQTLPTFMWRKVVAYATVHGRFVRGLLEFSLFLCYYHGMDITI